MMKVEIDNPLSLLKPIHSHIFQMTEIKLPLIEKKKKERMSP